jgi:hypothetical protein
LEILLKILIKKYNVLFLAGRWERMEISGRERKIKMVREMAEEWVLLLEKE